MATSAAASVARQLGSLVVEEAKFLYGVEEKVEELQQELAWMQGFLQDLDARQHKEELIRMWVSQVRDFAYKSEDVVEMYIHGVRRHGGDRLWDSIKRYSCILANAWTIHQVGSEIDNLTRKILNLNTRLKSYGVDMRHVEDSSQEYSSNVRALRQTHSHTVEKDLIKREMDIEKLANELLGDNRVVGVVGMGGLGKTTLVREVLRDKAVKERYGCHAWVYVSQQPRASRVFRETLRALKPGANVDALSEGELCEMVSQVLKERRCLVVLDDIWYKTTWRLLEHAFSTINESESKLVLTTRNEDVVREVDPNASILRPGRLNSEESWILFLRKAFPDNDSLQIDDEMEKVGKKMLKHCGGLPIAIVSLGGALATKKTLDEWEAVEKNMGKYLTKATGKKETGIGVLALSYNDLPFYLKPCFLCLGNFPEDYEIPTDVLYQVWQAEGLVQAQEENELESEAVSIYDVAEEYLKMLVIRCMVEFGQLYESGGIKTCRMHDMMREMCLIKSKEEKFLEVVTGDNLVKPSAHLGRSHRVAVHFGNHKEFAASFFDACQENALKPRSLVVFCPTYVEIRLDIWFTEMSNSFRLLRVLRLEGFPVRKLPEALGSCIHVRYLGLKLADNCKLPPLVWKLNYLQTLDLRESANLFIPNSLWKLKRLVHLYLPQSYKLVKDKLRLSQPRQMETLMNIDISHLHEEDVRKMANLRAVSFCPIESESWKLLLNSPMINSRMLEKPKLNINVNAKAINEDPKILVSSPHASCCIRELKIDGKIEQISLERIIFPNTVERLDLVDSELQGDALQYLNIPELRELDIQAGHPIKGNKLVFSSQSFPKLENVWIRWSPISSEAIEIQGPLPDDCRCFIKCPRDKVHAVRNAVQRHQNNGSFQINPFD